MENTTLSTVTGILELGIEPNHYLLLKAIKEEGWEAIRDLDNIKLSSWKQTLTRKGFLFDDGTLSPSGEALLTGDFSGVKLVKKKKVEATGDFEKWWEIFPRGDRFVHKSKTFAGSRPSMRIKKDLCAAKFEELVKSEKFTSSQIIEATKKHIEEQKELSFKSGQNKVSFIPNSERYLREECFFQYVNIEQPKVIGSIDI